MNIKHLNKAILFFLLSAINNIVPAQMHFKYSATLDTLKQSGFYRIPLSSDVLAKCQKDFADLRILDSDNNPAAYLLETEKGVVYTKPLVDLPIIKKGREGDKQWHIIIENSQKRSIDHLLLTINKPDASRNFTLSGSDDNKQWYVISENFNPELNMFEPDYASLYFPSSSYRYFQITQLGKDLLPIDVLKVHVFNNKGIAPKYSIAQLPYTLFQKDSSNKKSYVRISFNEPYQIEELELSLRDSPKYFKRHFSIHNSLDNTLLSDTFISSFNHESPTIKLSCKEKTLWLVIDNEDNSPLKINAITFAQFDRSLVAYFDSSKKYTLYFGDSTLVLPNYDIAFFKDSITKAIAGLAIGNIEKINCVAVHPKQASSKNKWIIWLCIGVALLLLLGITIKMLKDISEKKGDIPSTKR